jgi:mannose-6-phosphate isomerase-like protein (cupin superfamily)
MNAPAEKSPLRVIDPAELAWFTPEGRTVQRLSMSQRCEVLIVGWEPGQETSYHDHGDAESVVVVLSGEMVARNGDDELVVGTGQALLTPQGVHHQMRHNGPGRAVTLHIYAPPPGKPVSQPFIDRTTG